MTYERSAWQGPVSTNRRNSTVTPANPSGYRVTRRRVDLGSVVAEMVTTGPHRLDRDAPIDGTGNRIVVTIVGEGSIVGSVDDRQFTLQRGDVSISDDRHQLHYVADRDLRVLRVLVDIDEIPDRLLEGEPLPAGVIRRTALVNSSLAFVSALFAHAESGPAGSDVGFHEYLREALVNISIAMIAEAQHLARGEQEGTEDLRARIKRYTLDHLADPDLSPAVVARAVGISVRYAHQMFNRNGTTLARFIRERRLDQVAAELRDGRSTDSLGELGVRYGFGSRDQLARGFRQRFGRTMGEYRADQMLDHRAES